MTAPSRTNSTTIKCITTKTQHSFRVCARTVAAIETSRGVTVTSTTAL
jgi:hypothetical protein